MSSAIQLPVVSSSLFAGRRPLGAVGCLDPLGPIFTFFFSPARRPVCRALFCGSVQRTPTLRLFFACMAFIILAMRDHCDRIFIGQAVGTGGTTVPAAGSADRHRTCLCSLKMPTTPNLAPVQQGCSCGSIDFGPAQRCDGTVESPTATIDQASFQSPLVRRIDGHVGPCWFAPSRQRDYRRAPSTTYFIACPVGMHRDIGDRRIAVAFTTGNVTCGVQPDVTRFFVSKIGPQSPDG